MGVTVEHREQSDDAHGEGERSLHPERHDRAEHDDRGRDAEFDERHRDAVEAERAGGRHHQHEGRRQSQSARPPSCQAKIPTVTIARTWSSRRADARSPEQNRAHRRRRYAPRRRSGRARGRRRSRGSDNGAWRSCLWKVRTIEDKTAYQARKCPARASERARRLHFRRRPVRLEPPTCEAAAKLIVCPCSVGDDAIQTCPRAAASHPRSQSRARRYRRTHGARASRVRDRPAVAPQPPALAQIADRGGDRGGGRGRPARRDRDRAVPAALAGGAALFHRGRAADGRARGGADAAGSRGGGARSRATAGRIRLEVHETNHAAISRYRKSGYSEFGRHARYYEDGGDALRFEKRLPPRMPRARGGAAPIFIRPPSSPAGRPAS